MVATITRQSDDVEAALAAGLTATYSTVYSVREMDLPLTEDQFNRIFNSQINFFAGDASNREAGISSNTSLTNAVDVPTLIKCISMYVSVEPVGFTAAGAAIPAPDPATAVPVYDGVIDPGDDAQDGWVNAWLEWGIPTWQAAHALMQAYRLQMLLSGRLQLFSEIAADVGTLDSHSPWQGYSDSLVELPGYVAQVNAHHRALGLDVIFLPPTTQTVILPGEQAPTTIGVPTPLIPASYGGPIMEGLFCGCYPTSGLLLLPGMPIFLSLTRDPGDTIYFDALRNALVEDASADTLYDANFTGVVVGGVASAAFRGFKGGKFRMGIVMRGFELTPKACVEWYGLYGGTYGNAYAVQMAAQMLTEYALQCNVPDGLAGIPSFVAGLQEERRLREREQAA